MDLGFQLMPAMFDTQPGGSGSFGYSVDESEFTALFQALDQAEQPPNRIYTDPRWFEREIVLRGDYPQCRGKHAS